MNIFKHKIRKVNVVSFSIFIFFVAFNSSFKHSRKKFELKSKIKAKFLEFPVYMQNKRQEKLLQEPIMY